MSRDLYQGGPAQPWHGAGRCSQPIWSWCLITPPRLWNSTLGFYLHNKTNFQLLLHKAFARSGIKPYFPSSLWWLWTPPNSSVGQEQTPNADLASSELCWSRPIHHTRVLWELTRSGTCGTALHMEISALAVQGQCEKDSLCFYAWPTPEAVWILKMHPAACLAWCPLSPPAQPRLWTPLPN